MINNPRCPKCGAEMEKKIAHTGKNAGHEFWSCTRYPVCKGLIDMNQEKTKRINKRSIIFVILFTCIHWTCDWHYWEYCCQYKKESRIRGTRCLLCVTYNGCCDPIHI